MTHTGKISILLMNGRTVIPASQLIKILMKLHEGHQGIEKTRRRARDFVYWPNIDKQTENLVKRCSDRLPNQPHRASLTSGSTYSILGQNQRVACVFSNLVVHFKKTTDIFPRFYIIFVVQSNWIKYNA